MKTILTGVTFATCIYLLAVLAKGEYILASEKSVDTRDRCGMRGVTSYQHRGFRCRHARNSI